MTKSYHGGKIEHCINCKYLNFDFNKEKYYCDKHIDYLENFRNKDNIGYIACKDIILNYPTMHA